MKSLLKTITKHKVLSVIILSAIVLVAGGFTAFKIIMNNVATPPEMEAAPEFFEYETINSLKEIFAVSDEEKARSITSYSAEEGFSAYKRAFYNFLNTEKYDVITTGQTNVDSMGGILVDIKNEKKFDGTNFFMHLKSSAATSGALAKASNNDAMHYLYVTNDNQKNLATIKILDVNDPSKVESKTVWKEKDYVYNYGAIPYTACNFTIRENTVNASAFSFDESTGLYKIELWLDAVKATEGLVKQMHAVSGTDASYENGSVVYTAYVDSSFILRRTVISENYKVSTLGMTFSGAAESYETFYYEGEDGFSSLAEDEKYDLTDIPNEDADLTKEISQKAVENVLADGINADFVLSVKDVSLNGRLQVKFGDETFIRIDTEYKGVPISVYLSLDQTKSGTLIADVKDFKAGLNFTRIGDIINEILTSFGVDLGGMDVGTIVDGIDFSEMVCAFGNIEGTKISENVYSFTPNMNQTCIPLNIPFNMVVENEKIVSFGIDHKDVMGTDVYFSLTPSANEKDLSVLNVDESVCDLSDILSYLTEKEFSGTLIKDIIETKTAKFDISAYIYGYEIAGDAQIDFNDLKSIKFATNLNIGGKSVTLYYVNGKVYIVFGDIYLTATVGDITEYISAFTGSELNVQELLPSITEKLGDVMNSLSYSTGNLNLNYGKLSLILTHHNIAVSYGDKISAEISSISAGSVITAPTGSFTDISPIVNYAVSNLNFSTIMDVISAKSVSFNVNAEVNGFAITGNATVDFTEIKVPVISAALNVDGMDISVFYSDGTLLLNSGNVAVSATVADIKEYISIFTETDFNISSLTEKLTTDIATILNSAKYTENTLSLDYKNLNLSINAEKISLTYGDKISAEISSISAGSVIIAPTGNYVKLEGLKPLLEKINEQLSTRYFTANGSVRFGSATVRFENVKIFNEGNLKDPTEAFNSGKLTLSGTLYITANGATHKLFIQYINSTLYVVYKDEMKIKLSRASLDYIVDLVKNNYKAIIQRFNYSEILSADDSLTKLKDYKFTVGSVAKLLQDISTNNGSVGITLKAEDFGFTDSAILRAYLNNSGNLAMDISIGDKSGSISLDNTPFTKPTAPTGSFIDLSGITGLAEAAINAILKPSEAYFLSGSVNINIIGIINVDMDMDASVRLVSDGNGGKKIEAVAHVSCPRKALLDTAVVRSYFKFGKGTIVYKNEKFYLTRTNDSWVDSSTTRRSMSRKYFMDHAVDQICFLLGLTSKVVDKFASSNNEIKIEKLIKNYSQASGVHTFTIDGNELAGSSAIGDITAKITTQSKQLSKLDISLGVSSFIDISVSLEHKVSQTGNYSDITNLNTSSYTYLG